MTRRLIAVAVLTCSSLAGVSCDRTPDLTKALLVTDGLSGWYDNGLKGAQNHLVPSVTFRLKNQSDRPIYGVQLMLSFWVAGADGESDSVLVSGIGSTALPAGQSTEPMTVRSTVGYTLDQPRSELFTHGSFKDWTIKMFARRSGRLYPIGEFKVDRRIIPHVKDSGRP
jgi:hypothetical protein